MSGFDLHVHSTISDGAFPPAEVVLLAKEAGLQGIALTDHDSTAGLEEARVAAGGGLDVLTGCEVSSRLGDIGVHMLAYFVDVDHPAWVEALEEIRDDRVSRARKMVAKLQALGVGVSMEQVEAIAQGPSIGRPHIAQALVNLGVVENTVAAFTPEWIGDGGRAYVAKQVTTPHDTVRLIAEAGGVSVVAHPVWIEHEGGDLAQLIGELATLGLGGLEVKHPDNDPDARARYASLAEKHDLVVTASSDFHGLPGHGGKLGENACGPEVVEALRARAAYAQTESA